MDFFTPVVDDPYAFGAIAAANALSDVYAMGGRPVTVMNIACFDPEAASGEVWAAVFRGMADKTAEAGAVVVGGHSVEDDEPKFGMSVTGLVEEGRLMTNKGAAIGDRLVLSKPLGSGIVTTAAKFDRCSEEELAGAIAVMASLNRGAAEAAAGWGCRAGTDITGFGLVGHLWNVARESRVRIEVDLSSLPLMSGVERMVAEGCLTGGSRKNRAAVGGALTVAEGCADWLVEVAVDPQTSGGLAVFLGRETGDLMGFSEIGRVVEGEPGITLLP